MTKVAVDCVQCKQRQTIQVRQEDLDRWNRGEGHVQTVFPYLPAAQREMFVSRICGECWDRMFTPEDDEDETDELKETM